MLYQALHFLSCQLVLCRRLLYRDLCHLAFQAVLFRCPSREFSLHFIRRKEQPVKLIDVSGDDIHNPCLVFPLELYLACALGPQLFVDLEEHCRSFLLILHILEKEFDERIPLVAPFPYLLYYLVL